MSIESLIHSKLTVPKGNLIRNVRGGNSGEVITSEAGLGRLGEAAIKGQVFMACSPTLTLAASGGNLVGSSAGADTNTALINPSTSDKHLILMRVALSVNSGTFAAGGVYHGLASGQTVATSLAGMARGTNARAGDGQVSAGYFWTKGTQAALTGGAAPTQLSPIAGTTATAAANGYLLNVVDDVNGAIVLPPGGQYQPLFTGVGTTVIYNVGYTWIEVPNTAVQ